MEIGQTITIGRLGQQELQLSDPSIEPSHARLTRKDEKTYIIEDNDTVQGTRVYNIRIKRKTIQRDTPLMLGTFHTTVKQLLSQGADLQEIWDKYDQEKRKWDRYTVLVNSIRMLIPILSMAGAQLVGQSIVVSICIMLAVSLIAIVAGEKVMVKKTKRVAELNTELQAEYACPHCHKFLGLTPYSVLKSKGYCPNPACCKPLK